MDHPLSDKQFSNLDQIVEAIMNLHPLDNSDIQKRVEVTSVRAWADESVKLSLKYAYKGINPNEKPSKEYIKNGREIIDEQLAVAGYRLAELFKTLFSNPNVLRNHVKRRRVKRKLI